jgi:hypothetical protein
VLTGGAGRSSGLELYPELLLTPACEVLTSAQSRTTLYALQTQRLAPGVRIGHLRMQIDPVSADGILTVNGMRCIMENFTGAVIEGVRFVDPFAEDFQIAERVV